MSVFKSLVGSPASSRSSPKLSTPTSSSCRSPLMENASDLDPQNYVNVCGSSSSPRLRSSPLSSTCNSLASSSSSPLSFSNRHSRDENQPPRGLLLNNGSQNQRFHNAMDDENVLSDLTNRGFNAGGDGGGGLPLKRKRTLRLNIPKNEVVAAAVDNQKAMMEFMDLGVVEEPKSFDGGSYAYYSHKGKKRTPMEDSFYVSLNSKDHQAFFGVYDGHGGRKAVEFVSERLGQAILDSIDRISEREDVSVIKQAVKDGYLTTEREFLEQKAASGVCAVTALIRDGCLVCANVGDCRAVISKGGKAEALTTDHKPFVEMERIENLGGYVDCHNGVWRVQGSLAVSRSIGDSHMKPYVVAEPDIKVFNITKDSEFLILASDGLWDKVDSQKAVDIARAFSLPKNSKRAVIDATTPPPKARKVIGMSNRENFMTVQGLRSGELATDMLMTPRAGVGGMRAACKELADFAFSEGNIDDITIMLVDLRQFFCKG